MFFLLNDVVLNVKAVELAPPLTARRFAVLNFDAVRELGQELYAKHPALQHTHSGQAERLATLILAKAGRINAALFVAPAQDCSPRQVAVRFAELDIAVLADLHDRQRTGQLDPVYADRQVWRRLAA